jgi:hypothetical protein
MSTFVWQDKVKVTTGEISRASFFWLVREVQKISADKDADEAFLMRKINDFAVSNATYEVSLKQGDDFVPLDGDGTFEHLGVIYRITFPVAIDVFNALPMTLAITWEDSATQDNAGMLSGVFFESRGESKSNK